MQAGRDHELGLIARYVQTAPAEALALRRIVCGLVVGGDLNQELEKAFEELDRRVYHLKTLNDISRDIFSTVEFDAIINHFLLMIMGNFGVMQGGVMLMNPETDDITFFKAMGYDDAETLLITGHICVALKKFDDARDFYERVLALAPDNEDAAKNLQVLNRREIEQVSASVYSLNDGALSSAKIESTDINTEKSEKQDVDLDDLVRIDEVQESGMGLSIVTKLMDSLTYTYLGCGKYDWKLVKELS